MNLKLKSKIITFSRIALSIDQLQKNIEIHSQTFNKNLSSNYYNLFKYNGEYSPYVNVNITN